MLLMMMMMMMRVMKELCELHLCLQHFEHISSVKQDPSSQTVNANECVICHKLGCSTILPPRCTKQPSTEVRLGKVTRTLCHLQLTVHFDETRGK